MIVVNVFPLFASVHSKSKYWLCFNVYKKLKTCTSEDTCRKLCVWAPTCGTDLQLQIVLHGLKRAEYVFICVTHWQIS